MSPYAELLYAALDTEYGLIVVSEFRALARNHFDAARSEDPILRRVSVTMPKEQPTWLMLVKCPDEKRNLLDVITSSSTSQTSSGSQPPTETPSESPKPSE